MAPLIIIATATASDEIGEGVYIGVFVCFLAAIVLALTALVTSIARRGEEGVSPWLGVPAVLLSLIPLGFTCHLFRIDFVAVGGDGTPASGPLWKELLWPATPLLIVLLAFLITVIKRCRENDGSSPPFASRKDSTAPSCH